MTNVKEALFWLFSLLWADTTSSSKWLTDLLLSFSLWTIVIYADIPTWIYSCPCPETRTVLPWDKDCPCPETRVHTTLAGVAADWGQVKQLSTQVMAGCSYALQRTSCKSKITSVLQGVTHGSTMGAVLRFKAEHSRECPKCQKAHHRPVTF